MKSALMTVFDKQAQEKENAAEANKNLEKNIAVDNKIEPKGVC